MNCFGCLLFCNVLKNNKKKPASAGLKGLAGKKCQVLYNNRVARLSEIHVLEVFFQCAEACGLLWMSDFEQNVCRFFDAHNVPPGI
mgnify:CR=1 FL=1